MAERVYQHKVRDRPQSRGVWQDATLVKLNEQYAVMQTIRNQLEFLLQIEV